MRFEDLETWEQAREVTREIYALTRAQDLCRDFGLCGQIQRAAVSTMSNIAEGFERQHLPEKLQFYNVAHASNGEVRSLTYVIEDNYPKLQSTAAQLRVKVLKTGQLLAGLIRSTENRKKPAILSTICVLLSTSSFLLPL